MSDNGTDSGFRNFSPPPSFKKKFRLKDYWKNLFLHFGFRKCFLWSLESFLHPLLSPLPILGGSFIRRHFYYLLLKKCGREFFSSPGVRLLHCYNIEMGERCSLNYGCILNGRGGLVIGDDFTAGPDVLIWTAEHYYKDKDRKILEQGEFDAAIIIEDDVWCGARSVILPGVRLAKGTVVAAGAIVTKDTESYSVVGGVPARIIGRRTPRGE